MQIHNWKWLNLSRRLVIWRLGRMKFIEQQMAWRTLTCYILDKIVKYTQNILAFKRISDITNSYSNMTGSIMIMWNLLYKNWLGKCLEPVYKNYWDYKNLYYWLGDYSTYCDRLLLAHSANFIKLTFVVNSHQMFLVRLFCVLRLLRPGATACFHLLPFATPLRSLGLYCVCISCDDGSVHTQSTNPVAFRTAIRTHPSSRDPVDPSHRQLGARVASLVTGCEGQKLKAVYTWGTIVPPH